MFPLFIYVFFTNLFIIISDAKTVNCTCVPYYQCSESYNLIVDGLDLFDIRKYGSDAVCKGYFDVCCDATKTLPETQPTIPQTPLTGCGYVKSNPFPWYGTLHYQEDISKHPTYRCATSFIHKQVALTAAHCLDKDGIWTIRKGPDAIINVRKRIIHPSYSGPTLRNDIALIILDEPITLLDETGIICVPPPSTTLLNASCTTCTLNSVSDHTQIILVEVPIVQKQTCLHKLKSTRLGEFFQLHYSFICAGGENYDTCEGDGGSPLVCPIPGQMGRYHQIGIVSWGIGCAENDIPGIYVNVALYRDWIDEKMIENGFDIHSYRY